MGLLPTQALALNLIGGLGIFLLILTPWLFVNDIRKYRSISRPAMTLCFGIAFFLGWVLY